MCLQVPDDEVVNKQIHADGEESSDCQWYSGWKGLGYRLKMMIRPPEICFNHRLVHRLSQVRRLWSSR